MSTYEISKSSLLSLKAEILRKQEELKKTKLHHLPRKISKPLEVKNKPVSERHSEIENEEDADLLKKSQKSLESKAKLYEKLSHAKFTDEEIEYNRRYLVRFDKKSYKNVLENNAVADFDDNDDTYLSDDYDPPKDPGEEWIEYTDCLGRTRKCMRKDLEYLKSKDADFRASIDKTENKEEQLYNPESTPNNKEELLNDSCTVNNNSKLLSADMRRELLRQQWEKEEEELREKSDIHYQDILFSEARTHGVGYYAFSKDEIERAQQQDALKKLRTETQQQQKKAQELRNLREKQLAARTKAARNRKRIRMGLPPEEDEPEPQVVQETSETTNSESLGVSTIDVEKEKEREKARMKHIRPWDIGKEGIRKEHYEYTQEEWVDKKRKERPKDFAPPSSYTRSFTSSKSSVCETEVNKTLYFSSKKNSDDDYNSSNPPKNKKKKTINPYKSNDNTINFIPNPIVNECRSSDNEQDLLNFYNKQENVYTNEKKHGVEIPPPSTFEYYGPTDHKKKRHTQDKTDIEGSIAAGLKFLRQQAEKKSGPSRRSEDMFIM